MYVELASWNANKALTTTDGARETDRASQLFEALKKLTAADGIFVSEAFVTSALSATDMQPNVEGSISEFALTEGYQTLHTGYQDTTAGRQGAPEDYDHHACVLYRADSVHDVDKIRLANRNGFKFGITDSYGDKIADVLAAHFEDRSEALRLAMADAAVKYLAGSRAGIIMGDINSMHTDARHARLIRSSERLLKFLPGSRLSHIAQRLVQMAGGDTVTFLEDAGFIDVDIERTPTWRGIAQLDHIMARGIQLHDFKLTNLGLSDHSAISAKIDSAN